MNTVEMKLKFQTSMINAIERNQMYSLEGWTLFELHDLEFAADLQGATTARAAIIEEIDRRDAMAA